MQLLRPAKQLAFRCLAVLLAAAILGVDTLTPFDWSIPVLYVVVVLISTTFLIQRGVLFVGLGCMALTVASFLIAHGLSDNAATVRCAVSLCAIATTTVLASVGRRAVLQALDRATLLELTHDAIFVRDLRSGCDRISYWNMAAAQLYGWTGAEVLGGNVGQLMQTSLPVPADAIFQQLQNTGRWKGELVHRKRDGTPVVVDSRWSLQCDTKGTPTAILQINSDITERKQAEETSHRARSDLSHLMRIATLGELMASIGHEIRQPLSSIVTNGDVGLRWLAREVPNLAEVRSSLELMIASARRANELIHRLKALARKAPAAQSFFTLNDIVCDVLPLVERELAVQTVRLDLVLDHKIGPVRGDRVQMQQVLINLVLNAIQAMSQVGERPRILSIQSRQRVEASERHAELAVRDTGVGIDSSDMAHLFTAFYTTKTNGTGLGLSLCRSIVESHSGRIFCSPNSNVGATFTIAMPTVDERSIEDRPSCPRRP